MPIYEYLCSACESEFEKEQRITDESISECPKCGSSEVKRLISQTSFQLKGSGWYKTDYASGASNPSSGATLGKTSDSSEKSESSSKSANSDKKESSSSGSDSSSSAKDKSSAKQVA